jgi:hypothetical protein
MVVVVHAFAKGVVHAYVAIKRVVHPNVAIEAI